MQPSDLATKMGELTASPSCPCERPSGAACPGVGRRPWARTRPRPRRMTGFRERVSIKGPLHALCNRRQPYMNVKRQWRFIVRAFLGFIQAKRGNRDKEEEEEVRSTPTTRRQLERMRMVFRTTVHVHGGTSPIPEQNLQVKKDICMYVCNVM